VIVASVRGRAALVIGARAVDVERASGGRFGPSCESLYDAWPDFRAWCEAAALPEAEPLDAEQLDAPAPKPRQVFAIGLNYATHAEETGHGRPTRPPTFTKFPTCIAGPTAVVALPTGQVDWEVELVVVIGVRAERVAASGAWRYVAGLTVGQDLSARDVQYEGPVPQFSLGKSFPGFGPTGPWLVSPDELDDPDDLALRCTLNGELVQRGRTSQMLWPVPELIAHLSSVCPLLPGDLVFTGTPAGVGHGRRPPRYLRPGDELVSSIEGVGSFRTRFTAAARLSEAAPAGP
jgi:2-keto-4-pentenoate hydratase/2-oxohepta-3-ene-1,7-dioic acid hydratase in catechol pathway